MYFSLSIIALYATLISQTVVVSSAPVLTRNGDVMPDLHLRNLVVPKPQHGYARRQEAAPSAASVAVPVASGAAAAKGKGTAVGGGGAAVGGGGAAVGGGGAAVGGGGAAVGSGPKFVIYTDKTVQSSNGLPAPSDIKGYTHLMLGFLLPTGPADQSKVWASLNAAARKSLKAQYTAAGIKVMASAFGGTSAPTTDGNDPAKTAQTMAAFVKANDLDGLDVDYEDLKAVAAGTAVAWLETFMTTLRKSLPVGQFTVSHAPLAPHLSPQFPAAPSPKSAQGPYLQIDKSVGTLIDFYNVQFYNDGATVYTDCNGLLTKSDASVPQSSLFEIAALGVPLDKLVIGKPIGAADATNGQMTPALLGQCVAQATKKKWNGGVMGFEFEDAASAGGFIGPSVAALGGKAVVGGASPSVVATASIASVPPLATATDVGAATDTALSAASGATDVPLASSAAVDTAIGAGSASVFGTAKDSSLGGTAAAATATSVVGVPAVSSVVGVPVVSSVVGVPVVSSAVGVPAASVKADPGAAPTGTEPGAAPTGTEPGSGIVPTGVVGTKTVARRMLKVGRRS